MPKVPRKVVPTFSEKEIEKLLAQPDKQTDRGFRDYALLLTFVDTGARLSEIANLRIDDVDLEQGYLKAMGKGSKIRWSRKLYLNPQNKDESVANVLDEYNLLTTICEQNRMNQER